MQLPVVYVGGAARSGSTLLGVMLGQVPGFVWPGEIRWIWRKWGAGDQLCGCGEPFPDCPFWTAVAQQGFGGWEGIDAAEVIRLEAEVVRFRTLPLLRARSLRPDFQRRVETYCTHVAALYEAIRDVSGAERIVDTTKDPPYAFALSRAPGIDLRILHLTRDSRGVAFSSQKLVAKPDAVGRTEYMPRQSPPGLALTYDAYNLLFHALGALGVPRMHVRYESLVERPRDELDRILRFCGAEPAGGADWLDGDTLRVNAQHSASGNPLRFRRGPTTLRRDDEWRGRLGAADRAAVTALTLPLLLRYGYLGRTR